MFFIYFIYIYTHTDSYIHYASNHHPATKIGIITCLKKRAIGVCKGEYFKEELQHLTSTFRSNGYPMKLIRKALHKKKKSNDCQTNKMEELTLCLPYIKGLSETLQRTCQPLNIRVANKGTNTLRSILTKVKTPLDSYQKTGVIYQIPCSCGEVYIGETGKTINERVKEHKRSVCRMDTNNSIAVHVMNTSHDIAWDQATIITQETHRLKRKIKEAMLIQKTPCINMDSGLHLDPIWNDIINVIYFYSLCGITSLLIPCHLPY